ncbi:MAG: hypothetical protein ACFE0Q_11385 [Anaerolineae bacterium]
MNVGFIFSQTRFGDFVQEIFPLSSAMVNTYAHPSFIYLKDTDVTYEVLIAQFSATSEEGVVIDGLKEIIVVTQSNEIIHYRP